MTAAKTVLVLGGGIGGIVAASLLRKRLPRTHQVVLVEREAQHVFAPSLLWLMVGARREHQISRPIARLEKGGIKVVHGEIERIEPNTRSARVAGQDISADYLVVALGAELAPEAIPGLAESGHNFYTLAGAQTLNRARADLRQGRLVVLVARMPFKCPAAPYEAAMLLQADLGKRGLQGNVSVDLYTPEPGPMPVAGAKVSAMVRQLVESRGVRLHTEHAIAKIDPSERLMHFENGATASFDLLAYVPPHRVPGVVQAAGFTGESGWVPVDRRTLETKFPGVYAIGDVTGIPLVTGKSLPKAGAFAHGEAEVVANNIVHAITGAGAPSSFDGHGACFIEIGDGRAGFGSGNFLAEPAPEVRLRPPGLLLHIGKVAYEKYWLYRWF
ncbi:MAG: NAD(P)/FAD-dependent oxidoreductase [Rhizobiales bacterium]|nr:NAD(P)/FAD-dependent oxidoreductase [Hyphomicrobiales bacterium]MBI3674364.1 NAD(P)/FAD-dependent oxidoreductase [Hyphomicrobiales bacterium]